MSASKIALQTTLKQSRDRMSRLMVPSSIFFLSNSCTYSVPGTLMEKIKREKLRKTVTKGDLKTNTKPYTGNTLTVKMCKRRQKLY